MLKKFTNSGRQATNYVMQSLDGSHAFTLTNILECEDIPQNREEIVTPAVTSHYPHLKDIAEFIPPVDENLSIELLLGVTSLTFIL